ncbi:hypothetical protein THERMOS_200 [Bathymodiolus thermophilus thioautotrophic gill symbiont]|uniref:Uncharacterized protein n=1 Tax=Bathymodiolus thermophilus thioautotrophic gill symbiont TaxID=2360 RepID=A0A8H8XA89_9GAMM|nr:hypothetical protein THERMOS_200 [Bathymodiolus thermophilus thioautotrophic gill symbiont]
MLTYNMNFVQQQIYESNLSYNPQVETNIFKQIQYLCNKDRRLTKFNFCLIGNSSNQIFSKFSFRAI